MSKIHIADTDQETSDSSKPIETENKKQTDYQPSKHLQELLNHENPLKVNSISNLSIS